MFNVPKSLEISPIWGTSALLRLPAPMTQRPMPSNQGSTAQNAGEGPGDRGGGQPVDTSRTPENTREHVAQTNASRRLSMLEDEHNGAGWDFAFYTDR